MDRSSLSRRSLALLTRSAFAVLIMLSAMLVPLQANATTAAVADQGTLSPLEFAGSLDVIIDQSIGAPFVPSTTGPLARLDLSLQRTEHTYHDLKIQIFGTDGGSLESIVFGTPLGEVILTARQITTESSTKTVVFEPAVDLIADETYVILLSSDADVFAAEEESYGWSTLTYVSGDSGAFAYRAEYDQFNAEIPQQMAFTTYVGDYSADVVPVLPSLEGMENLISIHGSVTNGDGLMGVAGHDFNRGEYSQTSLGVDERATAQDVDCQSSPDAKNILCDPVNTTNSPDSLTQSYRDVGYMSAPACEYDEERGWCYEEESYVVIDLGALSQFSAFEVFQMHYSDGMVSHAKLLSSSNSSAQSPVFGDDSWSIVASGAIAEGVDQTEIDGGYLNDAVTRFDFAPVSSRYVMLVFQNDGTLSQDQFIQVAGAKLFGNRAPPAAADEFVTFDCDEPNLEAKNYFLLPDRTLSISYANCDDMQRGFGEDDRVSTGASEIVIPWSELSVGTPTHIDFYKTGMGEYEYVTWDFYQAVDDTSLDSFGMHSSADMPLNLSGSEHYLNVVTHDETEPFIGACYMPTGDHSFSASSITIQNPGDVRVRVIGTTPSTDAMTRFHNTQAENEELGNLLVADTVLAIYSDFDPAHPELNVLGCNDDRNSQLGTQLGGVVFATGWSDVTVSLEPGTYTLVLMAFGASAQNQSLGATIFSTALPINQAATVELWGQSGVIAPVMSQPSATGAQPETAGLAHTGFDYSSFSVLALALFQIGVALMLIRRKRRQ
jgi:hypothetical protein